jgi:hypothetical protein
LKLEFALPEAVLAPRDRLGVKGRINGVDLPPREYREPGRRVYSAPVPAEVLTGESAQAEFELDFAWRRLRRTGLNWAWSWVSATLEYDPPKFD